jgi:acetyl-CoA acetyltransferase
MAVRDRVAIVGLGQTDYRELYFSTARGSADVDKYGLAADATSSALAEAGLTNSDVDGLVVGPGVSIARAAEVLGLDVRWGSSQDACASVIEAAMAIACGMAGVVLLLHATDQRSVDVKYGGGSTPGQDEHLSYHYFAPWGLTSQGALYGLTARRFLAEFSITERMLAQVPIADRQWAMLNPHSILQQDLTLESYLAEPFIVDPFRRSDYCLVNDGAVAVVVTSADRARELPWARPVTLSGFAAASDGRGATSLRQRMDYYYPAQRRAAGALYEMASLEQSDIDCLQIYDSFSIHVPVALSGFGFSEPEHVGSWLLEGNHFPGGALPINTGGGHLSESYLHGWNHLAEAILQARGGAGDRQVPECEHVQCITHGGGRIKSLILSRYE